MQTEACQRFRGAAKPGNRGQEGPESGAGRRALQNASLVVLFVVARQVGPHILALRLVRNGSDEKSFKNLSESEPFRTSFPYRGTDWHEHDAA